MFIILQDDLCLYLLSYSSVNHVNFMSCSGDPSILQKQADEHIHRNWRSFLPLQASRRCRHVTSCLLTKAEVKDAYNL